MADRLEVQSVSVNYGPITALNGVSVSVAVGEIVTVLGANGAGKSTLLRTVSGLVRPHAGSVGLNGTDITRMAPNRIARAGVAHVPEGRRVVAPLTVEENLALAARGAGRLGRRELAAAISEIFDLFPRLVSRRRTLSGLLSGGEQQMLALGRAIIARPRFIMIDEPSMGLAPIVVEEVYALFRPGSPLLVDRGILLAEQSATPALEVATRGYILARGRVAAEGSPDVLSEHQTLLDAYLNSAAPAAPSPPSSGG